MNTHKKLIGLPEILVLTAILLSIAVSPALAAAPSNDNFADAREIQEVPFADTVDVMEATAEPGEYSPCNWIGHTVWYSFTPTVSDTYTASAGSDDGATLAVYTGTGLNDLQSLGCTVYYGTVQITLSLQAGTTYYYQASRSTFYGGILNFSIYPTPSPEVVFWYSIGDPSKFDNGQFINYSYDPYGAGIQSYLWDFGDGNTSTGDWPVHQFSNDGDYTVQLTATTTDGRTGTASQVIQVRTHDVGIIKLTAPTSGRIGQTKQISVSVKNLYYPETVQVDLYKVTQNGLEFIESITQDVPIRPPNRAQVFTYNYTFTSGDAAIGKVNFKAVVTIIGARDAFPVDNELISYATKVTR